LALKYVTSLIFAPQQTIVDDYMPEEMKKQVWRNKNALPENEICNYYKREPFYGIVASVGTDSAPALLQVQVSSFY
jgi:hypothetical protein